MEIFDASGKSKILERIMQLRDRLADWLIVEVRLKDAPRQRLSSVAIAELMHGICRDYDGLIMACNETEVLMLIEWGRQNSPERLVMKVRNELPNETCEAVVAPLTSEGLKRITLIIAPPAAKDYALYGVRLARRENVILIADDDPYMRALIKAGLKNAGGVVEVGNGDDVIDAYKMYNPDIILLDIHLPGLQGHEILSRLRALDPAAYVIMISADSSAENVTWTHQHGAKGFLAKPFNKTKLLDYVVNCPSYHDPFKASIQSKRE
jgi:two-component system chemotaxis response regulator CheY